MHFLRTFGGLALERDGIVAPDWDKHRNGPAILTVLAAEGAVSRDRLMALLWPESDSTRARGSLKQAVHQLRQMLGDFDAIQGERTLDLNAAVIQSDVRQFRDAVDRGDLACAVTLYQGPFLDGIHLADTPEFEQWVDERRRELSREVARALRQLAKAATEQRDHQGAAAHLERLGQLEPMDADVVLATMQAWASAGDRASALHAAQAYQDRMHHDLGISPDVRVAQLAERLRAAPPLTPAESWLPDPDAAGPPRRVDVTARRPRSRLLLLGIAATVGLVTLVAARRLTRQDMGGSADLVAVAPFQALDTAHALWREGVADILVRNLDGAGPLRTVSASATLTGADGANRAGAENLGTRTGAGRVVYGSLASSADSVVLHATILDRSRGGLREVEVRGAAAALPSLTDSLTVGILEALAQDHPIAASRHAWLGHSMGSAPLPALREFLRGEQYFRRGNYDSALMHYDRALEIAPDYNLALRRASQAMGWGPMPQGFEQLQKKVFAAPVAARGLAPRDSLLALADSFARAIPRSHNLPDVLHDMAGVRAALEMATRFYPQDPESWHLLGDALYHLQQPVRGTPREALAAFDKAIASDSGFAPAYEHTVELALQVGDYDRAAAYAHAALRHSRDRRMFPMRLSELALDSGAASPAFLREVDSASAYGLFYVGWQHLRWATDSGEVVRPLLERIAGGVPFEGVNPLLSDPVLRSRFLVRSLAFRGHLAESGRAMNYGTVSGPWVRIQHLVDPFLELALFGAAPDSTVEKELGRAFDPAVSWGGFPEALFHRHLIGAPWWFAHGDTASLQRLAARGLEMSRTGDTVVAAPRGRYLNAAAEAWLALARGDSTGARQRFRAIPDSLCAVILCFHQKMALARLELAAGDPQAAAAIFDKWWTSAEVGPSAVLAALDHARALEQAGDMAGAHRRYQFVAEAWRTADPVLQGYVWEAREGAVRVSESAPRAAGKAAD